MSAARRAWLVSLGVVAVACAFGAEAPVRSASAAVRAPVPRQQAIVTIEATHQVRAYPSALAKVVANVGPHRPITGGATVLPLVGTQIDTAGRPWMHVLMPGRAQGGAAPPHAGWILASHTTTSTTAWRIIVDTAARRATVYRSGRKVREYRVIVGAPRTPTPRGSFFVEEGVKMPAGTAGAPYALATSARSAVLHEFEGGPGQVALHGTDNVGGTLGTAVSHGCIRFDRAAITWIAAHVTAGAPITIR